MKRYLLLLACLGSLVSCSGWRKPELSNAALRLDDLPPGYVLDEEHDLRFLKTVGDPKLTAGLEDGYQVRYVGQSSADGIDNALFRYDRPESAILAFASIRSQVAHQEDLSGLGDEALLDGDRAELGKLQVLSRRGTVVCSVVVSTDPDRLGRYTEEQAIELARMVLARLVE